MLCSFPVQKYRKLLSSPWRWHGRWHHTKSFITNFLLCGGHGAVRLPILYMDSFCLLEIEISLQNCPSYYYPLLFGALGELIHQHGGCVAQSVGHLTRKSGVLGSIPGLATYFRFSFRFFKKGSCQLLAKVCARSTG